LGEAILAVRGAGRLRAYSAGSKPKGVPHPGALRLLERRGIATAPFASKSWNTFTAPGAPRIDIAITVCDNAAQESCPVFIGAPVKGHWGLPDPAETEGTEAEVDAAFEATWQALELRVRTLLATRFEDMDPRQLADFLSVIGQMDGAA
ncbi:MAG: low molecular weight phosphatase family protein, partial [Sphingobium sp. 32-64-5]